MTADDINNIVVFVIGAFAVWLVLMTKGL